MRFPGFHGSLAVLVAASALVACDVASQIKDGLAHSSAASETIEKQVGKKPEIGCNYNNGSFSQATVQFNEAPAMPLPELEKVVRAALVSEFKDEPAQLIIAFAYPKTR